MRSLSLHYATIQIASVAGESRRISVSGMAKARLLWLFRNFSILEFPVLTKAQQELVYQMWYSGRLVPWKQGSRDVIGTIEAFCPAEASAEAPAQPASARPAVAKPILAKPNIPKPATATLSPPQVIVANASSAQTYPERSGRPRKPARIGFEWPGGRFHLRAGLRGAASWRALTVLVLGAAMYLGPRYLPPKHPRTPQTQVAAVDEQKQRTHSEQSTSAATRSEAVPPVRATAKSAPSEAAGAIVAMDVPARVIESVSSPDSSPRRAQRNAAPNAPAVAAPDLPQAMAHDVASTRDLSTGTAPRTQHNAVSSRSQEVLIRVSVDAAGQAHSFQVLQGDKEKREEALKAARGWNFKPCAGGEACDQVLKFTDYGDSSRVQRIE